MKKEIDKILEEFKKTKFAREGGSCFECCDYEEMYEELESFISQKFPEYAGRIIEDIWEEIMVSNFEFDTIKKIMGKKLKELK